MGITVEGPGFSIEFPDGTDEKTINKQMSIANAAMKAQTRRQADEQGGAFTPNQSGDMTVGNMSRAFLRGLPFVGQYRDEASAWVRSKMPGGPSYEDALAKERESDKAFAEQSPWTDFGLGVGGGVAGTLPAAAMLGPAGAGGAAGAVGRTAFGLGARTLPGAVARGAAAGMLQGAAAGAGAAEGDFVDRGMGALKGTAAGAVLGAGLPLAAGGGARLLSPIIDRVKNGSEDALSRLSGAARSYLSNNVVPTIGRVEGDLARLGPLATLADVSPEFTGIAGAAAARPGGREQIARPLMDRNAGSNLRVQADLDAALGRAPIPSQVEAGLAASRDALSPEYGRVMREAGPVDTRALADGLEGAFAETRGPAQQAIRQVRDYLDTPRDLRPQAGAPPRPPGPPQLDPDPRSLMATRQAIDGQIAGETNPQVVRQLTIARQQVDDALAAAAPGVKDVDAQFAELMRQSGGLQRGSQALDAGKTAVRPSEMIAAMQEGALPQGNLVGPSGEAFRIRQGVRGELDRIVGVNGNDARAIQNVMRGSAEDGGWNAQKMETVFGAAPARQARAAVDREVTFQNTANRVLGNSETEPRRQFGKLIDAVESPWTPGGGSGGDATAVGLAVNATKRLYTMAVGAVGKARADRFASELGDMAVAQGQTRDDFVAAMKRVGMNRAQIERAYGIALKGGLIGSRELSARMP